MTGTLAALGAPMAILSCAHYSGRPLSSPRVARLDVSDLQTDGKALMTPFVGPSGDRIMIIRESAERFVALSMRCTHAGCRVKAPVGGTIECPCHGSRFDLTGQVLQGPAPLPLPRYEVISYDEKAKAVTIRIQ